MLAAERAVLRGGKGPRVRRTAHTARARPACLREVELRHSGSVLCGGGGSSPGLQRRRVPAARRHGRTPRVQQRMPVAAALLRRQRRLRGAHTLGESDGAALHPNRRFARARPQLRRRNMQARRPRRLIARKASAAQQRTLRRGRPRTIAVLAAWSEAAAVGDNGERAATGPPMARPALASSSSESTWQVVRRRVRQNRKRARLLLWARAALRTSFCDSGSDSQPKKSSSSFSFELGKRAPAVASPAPALERRPCASAPSPRLDGSNGRPPHLRCPTGCIAGRAATRLTACQPALKPAQVG